MEQIFGYYASSISGSNTLRTETYVENIRGLIPFEIQQQILNKCSDIPIVVAQSFGALLPETCDLEIPNKLSSHAASILRSQPNILNKIQFKLAANERYKNNLIYWVKENRNLAKKIEEYQQ